MLTERAVAYLVGTSCLLVSFHLLFRYYDDAPEPHDLGHSIQLSSEAVIVGMVYYLLLGFLLRFSPVEWGLRRRGPEYSPPKESCSRQAEGKDSKPLLPQEPSQCVPARLTIENMWCVVYGLGSMFFIAFYSLAGQHPLPVYSFSLGVVCLCIDYLSDPWLEFQIRQKAWESVAILLCLTQILLLLSSGVLDKTIDIDLSTLTLPWLVASVIGPFVSPIVILIVRNNEGLRIADTNELCEFAIPYMFMLATIFLFSHASCEHRIDVTFNVTTLQTEVVQSLPVIALSPLLGTPALILITTAVMKGHPLDPLISLSVLMSCRQTLQQGLNTPIDVGAMVCTVLAAAARIASVPVTANTNPDTELENVEFH